MRTVREIQAPHATLLCLSDRSLVLKRGIFTLKFPRTVRKFLFQIYLSPTHLLAILMTYNESF